MAGRRATLRAGALAASLVFAAVAANAEDTNRVAAATILFDEGVRALDAGRLEEACAKLAKSQELAPSGGTLLALAECNERAGRFASAWVAYRGAAARAAAAGKSDAEASALDHAAQLEPKLARLTVRALAPAPNLEILRDNGVMASSEIGVAVPIDPGPHQLKASAPGSKPWTTQITVESGASMTVDVPALEPIVEAPPPPVIEQDTGKTQRVVGLAVAGVGLGGLLGGGIFGLLAKSANDDGLAECRPPALKVCTAQGINDINTADTRATIATVLFIAGGALIAGGAVLFFTAPSPKRGARFDLSTASLRW